MRRRYCSEWPKFLPLGPQLMDVYCGISIGRVVVLSIQAASRPALKRSHGGSTGPSISVLTVLLRTGKDGAEPQKAQSHNSHRDRTPKNDTMFGAFLPTTHNTPARKTGVV